MYVMYAMYGLFFALFLITGKATTCLITGME